MFLKVLWIVSSFFPLPKADLTCMVTTIGDVGSGISTSMGDDRKSVIAYQQGNPYNLGLTYCNDLACTQCSSQTLLAGGGKGRYTSLFVHGINSLPIMAYRDEDGSIRGLRITFCNANFCTNPTHTIVDVTSSVGYFNSLQIDSSGLAVVSYYDWDGQNLKLVHCHDTTCLHKAIQIVDSVGQDADLDYRNLGAVLIAYKDTTNNKLKTAYCEETRHVDAAFTAVISVGVFLSLHISIHCVFTKPHKS